MYLNLKDKDIVVGDSSLNTNGGKHIYGKNRYETDTKIKNYADDIVNGLVKENYRSKNIGTVYGNSVDLANARKYLKPYGYKFVETNDVRDVNLNANDVVVGGQIIGADNIYNSNARWLKGADRHETESQIAKFERDLHGIPGFSTGGVMDKTGLAMLHGKPNAAEVVFNASQAKKLLNYIESLPDNLRDNASNFNNNMIYGNTNNTNNSQQKGDTIIHINIEHMEGTKKDCDDLAERIQQAIKTRNLQS